MKYVAPKGGLKSFTCPHCGVLSRQYHFSQGPQLNQDNGYYPTRPVHTSICEHCEEICLWHFDRLVWPNRGEAPPPNSDLPADVKADYEEAASVNTLSPRAASALLRLAIQKLCLHLGGNGKNINDDIQILVAKGLPVSVQQALDVVRVVGNNAVHPGLMDVKDAEIVGELFSLVNVIAEYMISLPNRIGGLYERLPEGAKQAIEKRDKKAT